MVFHDVRYIWITDGCQDKYSKRRCLAVGPAEFYGQGEETDSLEASLAMILIIVVILCCIKIQLVLELL